MGWTKISENPSVYAVFSTFVLLYHIPRCVVRFLLLSKQFLQYRSQETGGPWEAVHSPAFLFCALLLFASKGNIYADFPPVFLLSAKKRDDKKRKRTVPPCAEHRPQFIPLYPPRPIPTERARLPVRPEAATPPLSSRRGRASRLSPPIPVLPGRA